MSYNTRRAAPPNTAASVGQRRPGPASHQQGGNFVPAANNPNMTNKPVIQTPVHQQQQQLQQQAGGQRQQPQLQQQQQKPQTPQRSPGGQPLTPQQQQQQQQRPPQQFAAQQQANIPQQPKVVFKTENPPPPQPEINTNGSEIPEGQDANTEPKKKPFWMRPGAGRVNKKERFRRRNERLRRMLQPKNALMVLNELIGGTAYNVTDCPDIYDGSLFKCVVTVDGREHIGAGKSKPAAKSAAAESALKYLVLTRFKSGELQNTDVNDQALAEGEEKMETANEDANPGGISWSHVASYALHKLLSEWDENTSFTEKLSLTNPGTSPIKGKPIEKKPAKKVPDTAASMNPIMLLNQMQPNTVYEDIGRIGNPPHAQFSVKCTINGEVFIGTGTNKKAARKICAFAACIKVVGIQYPQTFLDEHGVTFDSSGNLVYAVKQEVQQQAMQVA